MSELLQLDVTFIHTLCISSLCKLDIIFSCESSLALDGIEDPVTDPGSLKFALGATLLTMFTIFLGAGMDLLLVVFDTLNFLKLGIFDSELQA